MEIDEREYNSVVLAALLHDVGKLLHRGDDTYKYQDGHEPASAKFVVNHHDDLKNDSLYDLDLVRVLVQYHDSKITKMVAFQDEYCRDKSPEKIWRLIDLVRHADSYSCAERDLEKTGPNRLLPLDSIFSYVNLDVTQKVSYTGKYRLAPFKPLSGFPASIDVSTDKEISELISQFEASIPIFSNFKKFEDVLNKWLNILQEYTWAVPSDTKYRTGVSDISLYDHLRSSAAIAACLYKRHIIPVEQEKRLDRINEFILVGGDFSGIQDYIFQITNRGSGGAAKRLRARSLFIYLFSEVSIHKILHALKLPIVCNLFSAGGKFLLLAPKVEGIEDALTTVKQEIEREIHDTYFSQFSFLMSWMSIKGFTDKFKVYNFYDVANDMFHSIEVEKTCKAVSALRDEKWLTDTFKANVKYASYQSSGDCKVCGKGAATHEEKDTEEEVDPVKSCFYCYRDKFFLGQRLPNCNYLAFGKGYVSKEDENDGDKLVLFHGKKTLHDEKPESYYVQLLEKYKKNDEYYLIYDIDQAEDKIESPYLVPIRKYYANYVFIDKKKRVASFEEIARLSRWKKNGISCGSDLLGVLKVDLDNLGLIFNKGFENPSIIEKGLDNIDRKTVSRFLTLSRMVELFFSGWMKEIMSKDSKECLIKELISMKGIDDKRLKDYLNGDHINLQHIYTVYSGGDDLVLVGPWETMIIFSIFLNEQFRKYTCQNKFITLSAGLTFVKSKYPIASAIKQADALLEKSKKEGKDRISLFGTTVKWEKLPKLINAFLFLNESIEKDEATGINTAFLHRLFSYHQMALSYLDEHKIQGIKYVSALSYDVGRNIVKRDKDGKIIKGDKEYDFFQSLINEKPGKDTLIYNFKIPLFWALYRHRVGR